MVQLDPISMTLNADPLITAALKEDITREDITTNCVMPEACPGEVELLAKGDGVLCGMPVFARVFALLDPDTVVEALAADGDRVTPGQKLAIVRGDIRVLLSGERTALNYLQRMSGIATAARKVVDLLAECHSDLKLLDSRKTTPNNRLFEKYAVRIGGGHNHRYNLTDGVMLKDNHIAAAGSITKAVASARTYAPFVHKIEVEVETLAMAEEALAAGADIIMLDNMDHDAMAEAIARINHQAEVEISGNITAESIAKIADLGADYISSGALTHSAPILDLSLKNLRRL
ncbi:carboxylating nicotinate-nucleotide diphosphorylase [Pseudoramibacter alactolyticus]|uniref:carboxylating nicotinate-nucleotide diphosphorylase n=1 Tax=Pseudoramibacter alactolyticus TaxID=113287 RepID=UPI0028EE76FD|nr:carboxylating nicotinate-nucleotide diphosphorylase [Pseudoramibacter alactolyticus]